MSSLAHSLVTWSDFLRLEDPEDTAERYELHDGEVVLVPPARPLHVKIQRKLLSLLQAAAQERGTVTPEFPYRPALNFQCWYADVAYIPQSEWDAMPPDEYLVYAPALLVEVLSPSNKPAKVNRQRITAMSAGTQQFWVVDPEKKTVQVTGLGATTTYASGDAIPMDLLCGGTLSVDDIFAV
jgi:Uma2 family endonuclease